jgi:hypothetical protein
VRNFFRRKKHANETYLFLPAGNVRNLMNIVVPPNKKIPRFNTQFPLAMNFISIIFGKDKARPRIVLIDLR